MNGESYFVFEVDDLWVYRRLCDQIESSSQSRIWGTHLEEDDAFLLSSKPTFFMIVSLPDEAASTVCRSIERLIFALSSCTSHVQNQPNRPLFR